MIDSIIYYVYDIVNISVKVMLVLLMLKAYHMDWCKK